MDTKQLTEEVIGLKATVSGHTEKMNDACARLDKAEREITEQSKLLSSIKELALGITHLGAKVDDIGNKLDIFGNRLRDIEIAPGDNWKGLIKTIIGAIAAALAGFFIAKFLT